MSERDLLAPRDPDAVRKLREDVAKVRADPEVAAAFHEHDYGVPRLTVEALRAGVVIDGYPCRLTVGTFALLRSTGARILGLGQDEGPLTGRDIAHAVFLLTDDCRNEAISVADDDDLLQEAIDRFAGRLDVRKATPQVLALIRRAHEAIHGEPIDTEDEAEPIEDVEPCHLPEDSWADDVDLVCHEYGWTDDYALWTLPLARLAILRESINARRSGKPRTARRAASGIRLLQLIERKRKLLCA